MNENEEKGILSNNQVPSYNFNFSPKKKGKKKKRKKKELCCISQLDFMASRMNVEQIRKTRCTESYYPPNEINLSCPKKFGFGFGVNLQGELIGKPQEQDGHIAVFGGSGTGKTTCIAIPSYHKWQGPIFALDFKGDLVEYAKKKHGIVLYLCENEQNWFYVDPFFLLKLGGDNNIISNARALAYAIIPLPPNIKDPFWIQAAREILTGCIVYFCRLGASFIDTMIYIKTHRISEIVEKIRTDILAAVCINPDLLYSEKTIAGISLELHHHISVFATDPTVQEFFSQSENDNKALLKWDEIEKCNIIVRIDQSRLEQWNPAVRLIITQLIHTLEKRPEKYSQDGANMKPVLLMLDEFPQLGKMEAIPSALRTIRSKAVTIAIFCQSLADLDETYGTVTRRAILDNCTYKGILGAYDAETQRYFSDLIGTVLMPKAGSCANFDSDGNPSGYGINVSENREYILQPHELAYLSDLILIHPYNGGFCHLQKITRFQKKFEEEN